MKMRVFENLNDDENKNMMKNAINNEKNFILISNDDIAHKKNFVKKSLWKSDEKCQYKNKYNLLNVFSSSFSKFRKCHFCLRDRDYEKKYKNYQKYEKYHDEQICRNSNSFILNWQKVDRYNKFFENHWENSW